MACFKLLE